MKKHLAVMLIRKDTTTNTTLCGRMHSDMDCDTDNNLTDDPGQVTCKLCKTILDTPKHWRHRKYLRKENE